MELKQTTQPPQFGKLRPMRTYFCQKVDEEGRACGLKCTYVAPWVEEAMVKAGEPLTRKPLSVQRTLWVECPIHGRVVYRHMGHHVSMGGKKKRKPSFPK